MVELSKGIFMERGYYCHERAEGSFNHVITMAEQNLKSAIEYCKNKNVAVQAGGHCGIWPVYLANAFESVYTFEPDYMNFRCLILNAFRHNVFAFNCFLGETAECRRMKIAPKSGSNKMLLSKGNVPTVRLDDFNFDALDLLALDVEGTESYVLLGAKNTINRYKPIVLVETTGVLTPTGEHGAALTAKFLEDNNYVKVKPVNKDWIWKHK